MKLNKTEQTTYFTLYDRKVQDRIDERDSK